MSLNRIQECWFEIFEKQQYSVPSSSTQYSVKMAGVEANARAQPPALGASSCELGAGLSQLGPRLTSLFAAVYAGQAMIEGRLPLAARGVGVEDHSPAADSQFTPETPGGKSWPLVLMSF